MIIMLCAIIHAAYEQSRIQTVRLACHKRNERTEGKKNLFNASVNTQVYYV
jgi:hypothetical protein